MNTQVNLESIKTTAETYYKNGDFYCSEAVVKTIKDAFELDYSDDVVKLASGFPVGIGGSGCVCGAIAGGVMALGMVFGRSAAKNKAVDKTMRLSKELHDRFKDAHKFTCCRALTKGMSLGSDIHMRQCVALTGEVAAHTASIILIEL